VKNEDFINNKQWENKINLQRVIQAKVLKNTGIGIPVEMCRSVLSYVNPTQQLYIDCYNLRDKELPKSIANGYTYNKGILTRSVVTVIVGNIELGYFQNRKTIKDTKVKSKLVILKITSFTTGSRERKFINKIKDALVFIRGVEYEDRFTNVKDSPEIMQE